MATLNDMTVTITADDGAIRKAKAIKEAAAKLYIIAEALEKELSSLMKVQDSVG